MNDRKKKSLGRTIKIAMISLVVVTVAIVLLSIVLRLHTVQSLLVDYNAKLGNSAAEISSTSMEEEVTERLMQIARSQADIVDSNFGHFRATVELLAQDATYLYEHAGDFGRIEIEEPKAENDGKLVVHITHSENTNMSDPAIKDEAGLLGNEQNTLISSHSGNPAMAKCYIATESGLMIEADRNSSDKLNEDGTVAFYEAAKRPWYYETREAGETHFTNITPEASGKRIGMMCGSPVTKNGRFMGVACAGMYLDDVDAMVNSTKLGENGIACIVNNQGQLLFSSDKTGILTITRETADFDLRQSENKELAQLISDTLEGDEGFRKINYNDEEYYVAYSPMETVGWSFVIMLPEKTVMASTTELVDSLSSITDETESKTSGAFRMVILSVVIIGILAILIAAAIAVRMSRSIVAPVQNLTGKVCDIKGDNLDFKWEGDTGDEIQTLAESFQSMTERMRQYIDEVTRITAEKERIGAELNVATQIQADMLPRIFPPFPERHEFDLYATMTPAKEVGGDFYDFFLVDDDHIGLVMADVSGKGVPAALFMVIAKTHIKNRAMMGGSPSEILSYANDQLCEGNEAELFVTVWMAIIEISTGKGVAANAGHEHPAIKRKDGSFELVEYRHSPAVATMEGIPFKQHDFELHPGDALFVYTDGVPEATNANNELYGTDRMLKALNSDPGAGVKELLENVKKSVDGFVGSAPQFDDLTMLAFNYYGPGTDNRK
ncbi:MAG: SpoIIE family protein phosphatase [Lachnospiraceae bacterium]|nr:SpoIIE family protein phosphatase [Lachnospiraceae bacterium]